MNIYYKIAELNTDYSDYSKNIGLAFNIFVITFLVFILVFIILNLNTITSNGTIYRTNRVPLVIILIMIISFIIIQIYETKRRNTMLNNKKQEIKKIGEETTKLIEIGKWENLNKKSQIKLFEIGKDITNMIEKIKLSEEDEKELIEITNKN